jgi:hypothetical protein
LGLTEVVNEKKLEIKQMQDQVKEAEQAMESEKQKCKERVKQVEDEFNLKERTLQDKLKRDMN